jgi:hypothetical protein
MKTQLSKPARSKARYTEEYKQEALELWHSSGAIRVRYEYDPCGRLTKISGDLDGDFTYAGYYNHLPTALYATLNRFYSPDFGRWKEKKRVRANYRQFGMQVRRKLQRGISARSIYPPA